MASSAIERRHGSAEWVPQHKKTQGPTARTLCQAPPLSCLPRHHSSAHVTQTRSCPLEDEIPRLVHARTDADEIAISVLITAIDVLVSAALLPGAIWGIEEQDRFGND